MIPCILHNYILNCFTIYSPQQSLQTYVGKGDTMSRMDYFLSTEDSGMRPRIRNGLPDFSVDWRIRRQRQVALLNYQR